MTSTPHGIFLREAEDKLIEYGLSLAPAAIRDVLNAGPPEMPVLTRYSTGTTMWSMRMGNLSPAALSKEVIMEYKLNEQPVQWESCCDERLVLGRCAADWSTFEFIKVTDESDGCVKVLHEIIFPDDYPVDALDDILSGFGYDSLDDFVKKNATSDEWLYLPDGSLDRENSPAYIIDWAQLAYLICEYHDDGIPMDKKSAAALLLRYTGETWRLDAQECNSSQIE